MKTAAIPEASPAAAAEAKTDRKKAGSRKKARPTTPKSKSGKKKSAMPEPPLAKNPKPAGSKAARILDLLERDGGASLAELMEATGWQAHSVRGFLSGTVRKKMGRAVASAKTESGERTYSVTR